MDSARPSLAQIGQALTRYVAAELPGVVPISVKIKLSNGQHMTLPIVVLAGPSRPAEVPATFVPTAFQAKILECLEGRAMKTGQLGAAAGDRGRLFRHPGGLKELQGEGYVGHHPRLGYFRLDSPPPELEAEE